MRLEECRSRREWRGGLEGMLLYTARMLSQVALGFLRPPKVNLAKKTVEVGFRCWPIDLDTYLHMNNAQYLRVSELSRWRIFPPSGLMAASMKKGWMFLAVEQTVKYLKPIGPFQRYVVSTKMSHKDNKWLLYEHTFQQHPNDVKAGQEPVKYAVIDLRAVLKQRDGKTVRPAELKEASNWNKDLLTAHEAATKP